MKKLFKHFFQTMLLFAAAWVVMMLPDISDVSYLNAIIWGLIAFVLVAMGVYLYWGHKKGLFALVGMMVLCLSQPVWAYQTVTCTNETGVTLNSDAESCSGAGCDYHKCMVDAYKNKADYCSLKDNLDVDAAVKGEAEAPKDDDIKNAVKYLDAYDRAAAAGCVEKHGWFMDTITLGTISGDDEDKRDCANDYLKKVAEYKKKKAELETETVYQILKTDKEKCWPCELVHIMIVSVEKLALSMEDELSKAAKLLLGVMFLFWLLYKVLMMIGQFGTANNAEFFTDLLTRFILAVVAVALLSGPMGVVYRLTFSSLLDITLNISSQVVAQANSDNNILGNNTEFSDNTDYLSKINEVQGFGSKVVDNQNLECGCCTSENSDCNGGQISECRIQYSGGVSYEGTGLTDDEVRMLFSKKDKQLLLCITCKSYKETAPFVAAGRVLVYHSWHNRSRLEDLVGSIGDLIGLSGVALVPKPISMWFIGMALVVCFSWIAYVIGFKLLDIFLRIGFIIILTPFLITAFVFPISRQYTKRGWDFLAHALLSIFAVSMGIALFMAMFKASLPSGLISSLKNVFTITEVGTDKQEYPNKLMTAICGGENGSAFYAFFIILLLCFCGINILQASQVIVEGLSGLTCGIPAISGVAVVGAIRAALAPFRMIKNIALDRVDAIGSWKRAKKHDEKEQERADDPNNYQPDLIKKAGHYTGTDTGGGGGGSRSSRAADRMANAAGKAAEKTAQARGEATQRAGQATAEAGKKGTLAAIKAAPATWGASLLAVPFTATAWGGGRVVQAAGYVDKKSAKLQGQVVKTMVKAGARVKQGLKHAKRIWQRTKRTVVNRIKQAPAAIKNLPRNMVKAAKKKFLKSTRRMRARNKYRHQKKSGHGPANWKRREDTGNPKPPPKPKDKDNKDRDKDNNRDRDSGSGSSGSRKEGWGRKILRGTLKAVDRADGRVDEALDGVENSFGNGGNMHLADTNSDE